MDATVAGEVIPTVDRTETASGARHPLGRCVPCSVLGLISLALSIVAYWHVWSSHGHTVVRLDLNDPSQNMGLLGWTSFAITHGHNPFYTAWINAPYGVNLVDNVGMQLLGALQTPIVHLYGPVVAYNTLLTIAAPISCLSAFALVRRYVQWTPAAMVGALLYGYSPYMVSEGIDHIHLVFVPFPPLVFLLLDELAVRRRRPAPLAGGLLGLCVVGQALVSTEILVYTVLIGLVAAVAGLVSAARARQWSWLAVTFRRSAIGLGVGGAVSVACLAYPLWVGLAGPSHIKGPVQLAPQQYRADLLATIVPDSKELISPHRFSHLASQFLGGNVAENGTYLGLTLIAVALLFTVWCWHRQVVQVSAASAVVAFVLSFGSRLKISGPAHPTGTDGAFPLPGAVLRHLPLVANALPVRLELFVTLFLGVILAIGLERVARPGIRRPARHARPRDSPTLHRQLLAGAVAVVALVPLIPSWPYPASLPPVPSYFTSPQIRQVPVGTITLVYPYPDFGQAEALGMLWQAFSGYRIAMVGGDILVAQAGTDAATTQRANQIGPLFHQLYAGVVPAESLALRTALRTELTGLGVKLIVAVPLGPDPGQVKTFLTWLAGRSPAVTGDAWVWQHCCTWRS